MYYDLTKGKISKNLILICTADDGGQSDATVLQYCGYTDCRARGWKECTRGGGVCLYTYDFSDLDFSGTFHGGRSLIFHL